MKTLTWLHISDIHSCPAHTGWDASFILDKLKDDLNKLKADYELVPDIIFVTGDIMYGAKPQCGGVESQYETAALFLVELMQLCNVPVENIFIVPGNHDVNRNNILASQTKWLKDQKIEQINDMLQSGTGELPRIMERLDNYRQFLESSLKAKHLLSKPESLIYAEQRIINGNNVGIAGFNTAWSSCGEGPAEKGKLWFAGDWQIKTLIKELTACDIKIALSHHPFDWHNPLEDSNVCNQLQDSFHFHLHGHDHQGWVEPLVDSQHCRIAAGAVYVYEGKAKQNGFNMVRLDFDRNEGEIWFRRYEETGGGGWAAKEIPGKTDSLGRKTIELKNLFPAMSNLFSGVSEPETTKPAPEPFLGIGAESRGIYGRENNINDLAQALCDHTLVVVTGLAGIGKSQVINEVLEFKCQSDWQRPQRFRIEEGWGLAELFSLMSPSLGNADEFPSPPPLLFDKRNWSVFIKAASKVKAAVFHLGRVENLLTDGQFTDSGVRDFLNVLAELPNVRVILESRESPNNNFLGASVSVKLIHIKGLKAAAVKAFFAKPDPVYRPSNGWKLTDEEAEIIFKRLGGSEGRQGRAHPMGMRLLATVSEETGRHPIDVLNKIPERFYLKLEQELFRELFEESLTQRRREMLEFAALYRSEIPDSHIDALNKIFGDPKAFDDLRRLFLVNTAPGEDYYFVHDLIRELTQRHMEKSGCDVAEFHERLAKLWLDQIRETKRASNPNRRAATEALYHILQSGSYDLMANLPASLVRGGGLIEKVERLAEALHRKGDNKTNKKVLEFLIAYTPNDHKSQRFLGETIEGLQGIGHPDAFEHYWKAQQLRQDFPPYLANIGRYWLRTGEAHKFIALIEQLAPENKSKAVNEQILTIQARCFEADGQANAASALRMEQINNRTKHPALYNDEAQLLLNRHSIEKDPNLLATALNILQQAAENDAENEYTLAMKAKVFEAKGEPEIASALRMEQINNGSRHSIFYKDEVRLLFSLYSVEKDINILDTALNILHQAAENSATDAHTLRLKAKVLETKGDSAAASALRMEQIKRRTNSSFFYCDEAQHFLDRYSIEKDRALLDAALDILQLASENGAANDFTLAIKAKVLEAKGEGEAASALRMGQINTGSKSSVFYSDEAQYLLDRYSVEKMEKMLADALDILQLALNRNMANEYILSIKAKVLEAKGEGEAASALRMEQINAGTKHAAFYNDEALYLLKRYDVEKDPNLLIKASNILEQAVETGATDEYTFSRRAKILAAKGETKEASALRMEQINAGTTSSIFYCDEVQYLLDRHSVEKDANLLITALSILERSVENRAINKYTREMKRKVIKAQRKAGA